MLEQNDASALTAEIDRVLGRDSSPANVEAALDATLVHFRCQVGTVHRLIPETQELELVVHRGVPPPLLERVRLIPMGKGMAGQAALLKKPVSVCNLQTDNASCAKPAAKQAGAEGSLTVPILVDGELRGTLGIALPHAHDFTE